MTESLAAEMERARLRAEAAASTLREARERVLVAVSDDDRIRVSARGGRLLEVTIRDDVPTAGLTEAVRMLARQALTDSATAIGQAATGAAAQS